MADGFDGALAYLDRHVNREATAGAVRGLSLDRMRELVELLGDPHRSAPVIHVTGTNGKGSTARMISAVLGAHGLSVGTYASPHLESITERILRDGEPMPEIEFVEVMAELERFEPLLASSPSYFDLLTAAAFSWFAQQAVDVMVVEVGMLGRFDSTNVVEADVAVITNVGRDHTDGSGDWRRRIAEEKAGIIEPHATVVVGETDPDLVDVFRAEGGARYWVRDLDFGVASTRVALGGRQVDLVLPSGRLEGLFLPAHGAHQLDNAAAAVAAVEAFFDRALDPGVVAEGLASVRLPGRFEVVGRGPLVVIDCAHNPDGTATAAATYRDEFEIGGRLTLVTGLLAGRDVAATLEPLLALRPSTVVVTKADSPRAVPAEDVASVVRSLVGPEVTVRVVPDVADAVGAALDGVGEDDAVLIAGSFYIAGDARTELRRRGLFSAR